MKTLHPYKNEQGTALVIALMFVAVLSLLGTTAVVLTTTDMQIGGNYRSAVKSYYVAEAGIEEAVYRMNLLSDDSNYIGESSGTVPTPGWGQYIVLQTGAEKFKDDPDWDLSSDSLNNDGDGTTDETDETYPETATVQTVDGNELNYLVKAHYKIEDSLFNNGADNDEVVLYGQDFGYGGQAPISGEFPVWVVTSIGETKKNPTSTTITGEFVRLPLNIDAKAALACDNFPSLGGTTLISGFNHDLTTAPANSGRSSTDITGADLSLDGNGQDNHGGPERYGHTNYDDYDINLLAGEDTETANPRLDEVSIKYGSKIENDSSTYLPGVWSTGDTVVQSGTDDIYGGNTLEAWKDESVSNSWMQLYELLGITSAECQVVLDKADVTIADTSPSGGNLFLNVAPEGITYIANGGTGQTLKFSTHTSGWGIMYITGDLDANNLEFKGLIYVEGTISLAGGFWLLGAMCVKGGNPTGSGGGTILYSKDALNKKVGDAMKYITLSLGDKSLMP